MKRNTFTLVLLLIGISFGCSQKESIDTTINITEESYQVEILHAILPEVFHFTKATIEDPYSAFEWDHLDNIAVHIKDANSKPGYRLGVSVGGGLFKFDAPSGSTRDYYSIYPFDWAVLTNHSLPLIVNVPNEYSYEEIKDNKYAVGMVAENNPANTQLYFWQISASLRLTVTGVPANTEYLTIKFDKCVTGSFEVQDLDFFPSIRVDDTASAGEVTIYFEQATTQEDTYIINIPMPLGVYTTILGEAFGASKLASSGDVQFNIDMDMEGFLYEFTLDLSAASSGPVGDVTTTPMDVIDIDLSSGNYGSTWN